MIRTITPIFSIIIALLIFFFYAKPEFAVIKSTQGEAEQYNDAAATAAALNSELNALVNKKRSFSAGDLARLDALVPADINEVKILTDLNEIARTHNMLFGNIDVKNSDTEVSSANQAEAPGQKVAYTDFVTSDITFSLIGTYEQFKAFLADVEKSLVLLEVLDIEFTAGEGNLQQYTLTVRSFSLPPTQ
jgi:large-conductance mechanosensitive channel